MWVHSWKLLLPPEWYCQSHLMNVIQLNNCWRTEYEFSWNNFYFMLISLVIWNLNITVSTTLKYSYKKALNKKLKLIGGTMKYFPKKLLGHEIFRSMISLVTNVFEQFVKPSSSPSPPFYILNKRSLTNFIK